MPSTFPTILRGEHVEIQVDNYRAAVPMRITGTGFGDADPPEDEEFDFTVLGSNGQPHPYLDGKLTQDEEAQVQEEFHIVRRGEMEDDFDPPDEPLWDCVFP